MTTLDLKPLTDEAIEEMNFSNHDLWLVKIQEETYGPFETESLKQFAFENASQFQFAQATTFENNDFKPFWSHASFSRRKVHALSSESSHESFWLMDKGLKAGPFTFEQIDSKIASSEIAMTEHISTDDGLSWCKVYELKSFDRRSHSAEELPCVPLESSFTKASLSLADEQPSGEDVADMVYLAHQKSKVIQFKISEISHNLGHNVAVSSATKWFLPSVAMILVAFITTGYFLFSNDEKSVSTVAGIKLKAPKVEVTPKKVIPQVVTRRVPVQQRVPASVNRYTPPPAPPTHAAINRQERVRPQIETHPDEYVEEPNFGTDPRDMPYQERENNREEHSLVKEDEYRDPRDQDYSLDAAMNGEPYPAQPVVEELSDF